MITKEISAAVRNTFGKGPMRQLRGLGKTPGVVYGGGTEALALQFETAVLFHELLDIHGRNAVITLKIDNGTERNVLVQEIQVDPVKDFLYHADFVDIDVNKTAKFSVPIDYSGKAKGVDLGGILMVEKTKIVLEGAPLSIPDKCVVNIREMKIGDKITVGSIALPEGVKLVTDAGEVCIAIIAPS